MPRPVAAIFSNGIGDAVLTLPAIRALMQGLPEARLIVSRSPAIQEIFDEFRERIVALDFTENHEFSPKDLDLIMHKFDRIAFYTTWRNASLEEWISNNRNRTPSTGLLDCFSRQVSPREDHYFYRYGDISKAMGVDFDLKDFTYPHTSLSWDNFDPRFGESFSKFGKYLVIHPDTKAYKCLEGRFWEELVDAILDAEPDCKIIGVGRDVGKFITKRERVTLSPPNFSLSTFLVSNAERFIGVDSCFLHYADLQRIPSLALVRGGADQRRWGLALTPKRATVTVAEDADLQARVIANILSTLGT